MAEGIPEYYPGLSVLLSRVLNGVGVSKKAVKRRRITMAEGMPEYYPGLSVLLSRVLNGVGVSKKVLEQRRNAHLFHEKIYMIETTVPVYIFGSQTEGTTTLGLNSDMDILLQQDKYNIIQDWSEWVPGCKNVLLQREDIPPGYRRMLLLKETEPLPEQMPPCLDAEYTNYYCADRSNSVLVKNTFITEFDGQINGPAVACKGLPVYDGEDQIYSFRCKAWPSEAEEWKRRHQAHPTDWITTNLLEKAVAKGFFLVPVGHKFSETPDLEWRVSLSYTERLLMFNLNLTQIKCHVLLKMIVKTFITPQTGKSITSYHCKTALFHCIKHTGKEFWSEDHLLHGIDLCLEKLLTFIRDRKCPHFMMPDVNLFDGKITPGNSIKLMDIMNTLIQSRGRFLLSIQIDGVGRLLQDKLSNPQDKRVYKAGDLDFMFHQMNITPSILICLYQRDIIEEMKHHTPRSLVNHLHQMIQTLQEETRRSDNKHRRVVIRSTMAFLSCWIGSVLSSIAIAGKRPLPVVALQWFKRGTTYSATLKLKVASALYCSGEMQKAEFLLCHVEDQFQQERVFSFCLCDKNTISDYMSQRFDDNLYKTNILDERLHCTAPCIRFIHQDLHCAPRALHRDIHRSMGDDIRHREPDKDAWMDMAVVDCPLFLYYLQYLTYSQLGKQELKIRASQNLERCLKSGRFGHLETGWTLLGQCMEQEQNVDAAFQCYETSLEVRPRNNAAKWHMQNLRYRKIRGEI